MVRKGLLPDREFLQRHPSGEMRNGLMLRWNDFEYPDIYLKTFNKKLWAYYNSLPFHKRRARVPRSFGPRRYINKTYLERNCPSVYYFAPQRESRDDVLVINNHFITPEMRMTSMYPWVARLAGMHLNDIQWRYDELSAQIMTALDRGPVDYATAKRIVDFLAPYGKFPLYYQNNLKSADGEIVIGGSVSLFDLKRQTVESHYGYYCDEWVKLTLPLYVSQPRRPNEDHSSTIPEPAWDVERAVLSAREPAGAGAGRLSGVQHPELGEGNVREVATYPGDLSHYSN
jgi:hypothetical protein